MRKLFVVLVAIFLMASSAYALVETAENGPQNITVCYIVGTAAVTSGNVVVLQTTSPTYPGKEVTGATTEGRKIYGVVVDTNNYTVGDLNTGKWIRVQTYGYCPIIKLASKRAVTANTSHLITSSEVFRASGHEDYNTISAGTRNGVTGNSIAFESKSDSSPTLSNNYTFKGFLGW